jgi:hypothetical protein
MTPWQRSTAMTIGGLLLGGAVMILVYGERDSGVAVLGIGYGMLLAALSDAVR